MTPNINKQKSRLIYARPWNREQFHYLARAIWPEAKVVITSEHRRSDESGYAEDAYRYYRNAFTDQIYHHLSRDEIDDIILRCRLLRTLNKDESTRLIYASACAFTKLLDREQPDYILSITVDSYILHVLSFLAKKRDIKFVGLVGSFVNGFFRVTTLGERNELRAVPDDIVKDVTRKMLDQDYRPDFVASSLANPKVSYIRRRIASIARRPYFLSKMAIERDWLNYHYRTSCVHKYGARPLQNEIVDDAVSVMLRLTIKTQGRKRIFFPLQQSPEATIDYWSADTSWIFYERKVLSILRESADEFVFLIKEHPNVVGMRSRKFYAELRECKNVLILPATMRSNEVIAVCDGVVACTGSVGFESALRRVPVFSDAKPWNLPQSIVNPIAVLKEPSKKPLVTSADPTKLVRFVLRALLPGVFANDGSWSYASNSALRDSENMAKSLRVFLAQR